MLSKLDLKQEGDEAHGYRISATEIASALPTMFVVREGERDKIIGSKDSMETIGRKVLDLLNKNDLDGARWWLDPSIPDIPSSPDGWMPAAHDYWPAAKYSNRGSDAERLAAASLIAHYDSSATDVIAILKEAYAKAGSVIDKAQNRPGILRSIREEVRNGRCWHLRPGAWRPPRPSMGRASCFSTRH
jgi:hypothetical protein